MSKAIVTFYHTVEIEDSDNLTYEEIVSEAIEKCQKEEEFYPSEDNIFSVVVDYECE